MKLNIKFDWAFITSVFTIFLFWCGYWYNYGYVKFFGYDIDAFDLLISAVLLKGLLIAVDKFFYLALVFLTISFVSSISLRGWKFIGIRFLIRYIANIFYIFSSMKKSILVLRSNGEFDNTTIFKKIKKLSDAIDVSVQKKLFLHELTDEQIILGIKKNEDSFLPVEYFQMSLFLHYFLLIFLLVGFLKLFDIGAVLINAGEDAAKKSFDITVLNKKDDKNQFHEVRLKNVKMTKKLYKTDFCMKGECLVIDENRNSQSVSTKEFEVIFSNKK